MAAPKKHVVMIALPAFGHIIPMIELSKKLIDHNFDITFVVSATKVPETKNRALLSPNQAARIKFYPLEDGLPEDIDGAPTATHITEIENAMEPPLRELIGSMTSASNASSAVVSNILPPVNAVITDFWFTISVRLCKQQEIPCFMFNTAPAAAVMGIISVTEATKTCPDEAFLSPPPPGQNMMDMANVVLPEGAKKMALHIKAGAPFATGIINNSFRELEGFVADKVAAYTPLESMPFCFIGPVLQQNDDHSEMTKNVVKWLDAKETNSVVYVSFGSMVFPSVEQLKEIASALVQLQQPFIWSLRTNQQENLQPEIKELIKRQLDTSESSFLILPWVSQQTILAHPSVKVFVSHCGWNGTLEAITNGKPVVAWPMFGDQHVNAMLLEMMGMGVTIPGTALKPDRVALAAEISAAIGQVGGWGGEFDGNNSLFDAAQELKMMASAAIAPDGSSSKDFLELANNLIP